MGKFVKFFAASAAIVGAAVAIKKNVKLIRNLRNETKIDDQL
ncbi:hypothetical protein [Alicyclobacillus fastidiosus]|uniref:DUF3918 domain-containing protein n=1 Tax=Alicyclobacillus fastidiosus TaxID=392011 RepID=A0ABV5A8M3_9BACL|nr:hypothetical protein [Alicyclobacillus fastidiosus]WEH10622.1 hypothetical protein PYS47_05195 [Alicyclobacillus fastidiosus]